ncbi:hypothetical protein PLESTB_000071300 [Pleodorina starrii]|uniref:DUF155 domain-containing protein n=1 Tax=Pleodorina starrii TaxID=330485 RepID=A0A9W6B9Z6_9CHLO|nr:hypothetical protein PLESTM_000066900 [Pleodorina starrii]GLC48213.1 hypothetical protein PLESTB_000071300 [Pleodorina starrii]GLC66503.1 hypothetical protein PLESTF_000437600 [Pleodorina starrii]
MRSVHSQILSAVFRQVAISSERAAPPISGIGAATTAEPISVTRSGFATLIDSWLLGARGLIGSCSPAGVGFTSVSTRGLSAGTYHPPHSDSRNNSSSSSATSSITTSGSASVLSSSSNPAVVTPTRQQVTRSKSTRLHARTASGGPVQPVARGPKVPSAKAAAAMAAAKAGGQLPLPREARMQLDAQLAEMPLPQVPYRGRAVDGPRTVQVTGFYIGHPFTRAAAEAVAARFQRQPLARGVSVAVAGVYHDHEDALVILHHQSGDPPPAPGPATRDPPVATAAGAAPVSVADDAAGVGVSPPASGSEASTAATGVPEPGGPEPAAVTAAAPSAQEMAAEVAAALGSDPRQAQADAATELEAEGGPAADAPGAGGVTLGPLGNGDGGDDGSRQEPCCMAIMLLEYGGVVFFNVPESLHAAALALVAATTLPDAKPVEGPLPLPRQPPLLSGSRKDIEAWQQAVADKLSMHKEEQLIVVDPNMMAGRGSGRWIRKLDDLLHIWSWDSTNLESIARVLSQSAAIRYYNQECEDMLERYETIMPLGYEPPDRLSTLDRLLFWRSRLPLRDLRQMVFKSSGIRVRLDSRLGLRDPPSGTWESARHHAVWDAMRREFELDDRRDNLMEKTDLLKQSCLDLISANNESFTKRSELSIILLISLEILISLTDLHSSLSVDNVGRAVGWALQAVGLGAGPGGNAVG